MLDRSKAGELAALLEWYRDMGVDLPVGEEPINWLGRGDAASARPVQRPIAPTADRQKTARGEPVARELPERPPAPTAPARQFPAATSDAALPSARAAARSAASLAEPVVPARADYNCPALRNRGGMLPWRRLARKCLR